MTQILPSFDKDAHLLPVDPDAGNEYSGHQLPTPSAETQWAELETVREMAELRDCPLEELDDASRFQTQVNGVEEGQYISYFMNASYRAGAYFQSPSARVVCLGDYCGDKKSYDAMRKGDIAELEWELHHGPMSTGRDLGSAVHKDWPFQFFARAALCCMAEGVGRNPNRIMDTAGKASFIDDGAEELFEMMAVLHRLVLRIAWAEKWEKRVARPERLAASQGDYLPMLYPEGSPVHPSFPAGHSVCAGAMITFLKAWFQNADLGDGMTVHGQLNVLSANVSDGRSWAGVHNPADNLWGQKLGEQIALDAIADSYSGAEILPLFNQVTI